MTFSCFALCFVWEVCGVGSLASDLLRFGFSLLESSIELSSSISLKCLRSLFSQTLLIMINYGFWAILPVFEFLLEGFLSKKGVSMCSSESSLIFAGDVCFSCW